MNRENQQEIQSREHQSLGELVAEFIACRSELQALVETLAQGDLDRQIEVRPNHVVDASVLLHSNHRHARGHIQTLRRLVDSTPHRYAR